MRLALHHETGLLSHKPEEPFRVPQDSTGDFLLRCVQRHGPSARVASGTVEFDDERRSMRDSSFPEGPERKIDVGATISVFYLTAVYWRTNSCTCNHLPVWSPYSAARVNYDVTRPS